MNVANNFLFFHNAMIPLAQGSEEKSLPIIIFLLVDQYDPHKWIPL